MLGSLVTSRRSDQAGVGVVRELGSLEDGARVSVEWVGGKWLVLPE